MEPAYRSDHLFQPFGGEAYRIAQRIERGQTISAAEARALPDGVNARYGEEITLLFHALGARNVEAIDTLLGAGADPYMIDRPSTGSTRSFVFYLTLPGHPTDSSQGFPFINGLIRLYLKHGGDPNYRLGEGFKNYLIADVALIRNYEGMELLLEAGVDPWFESEDGDSAMSLLALRSLAQAELNRLIDRGYFDKVPLPKLQKFMRALSGYLPRGDDISLANQRIGRRVLKRNPDYPADQHTKRLFQGSIPWKEIENEQ